VWTGPGIFPILLIPSILVQDFIVRNYSDRFLEAFGQLTQWVNKGELKYIVTIIHGFNILSDTFLGLFSGKDSGEILIETD
jgi:NADPH-dependent curcumin reductase CurA